MHSRAAILGERWSADKNRSIPPLDPTVARASRRSRAFPLSVCFARARCSFVARERKTREQELKSRRKRDLYVILNINRHRLARDLPECTFAINGGLQTLGECHAHVLRESWSDELLPPVHSAMVGRSAWYTPWRTLARADSAMFGKATDAATTRRAALERYCDYASTVERYRREEEGSLFKPLYYLFAGERAAKDFRNTLVKQAPLALSQNQKIHTASFFLRSRENAALAPSRRL